MELIDAAAWMGLSKSTCCIVIILSLVSSGSLCQRCFKSILTQCHPFHRYVDYLLDALRRRGLFMWLELQPATFWHTLLFRFACYILPSATASAALRISRDYSCMLVQLTHFCSSSSINWLSSMQPPLLAYSPDCSAESPELATTSVLQL